MRCLVSPGAVIRFAREASRQLPWLLAGSPTEGGSRIHVPEAGLVMNFRPIRPRDG